MQEVLDPPAAKYLSKSGWPAVPIYCLPDAFFQIVSGMSQIQMVF
jgi:hypothetical protein